MEKKEILSEVARLAKEGKLEKDEVLECFEEKHQKDEGRRGVSRILTWAGAGIVFLGIVILVFQYWNLFSDVTRVLLTLGVGVAAFLSGVFFFTKKGHEALGVVAHLLAALLLPVGIGVFFETVGASIDFSSLSTIFLILSLVYLATFWLYRKTLFLFFLIFYGTVLFFSFTSFLMSANFFAEAQFIRFFFYRVFAVGLSFLCLGYYFSMRHAFFPERTQILSGALYGFGALAVLGSALVLGGFEAGEYPVWNIIYPLFLFAVLYLSPYVRSRTLLAIGILFLVLYIFKMTAVYFAESVGWPLALVVVGFVLVGVGFLTVRLNKRFEESR